MSDSDVADLDEARAAKAAKDKERVSRLRAECVMALRRKIQRLLSAGYEPNSIIGALFLTVSEFAVRGGMSNDDVHDAVEETVAFVRFEIEKAKAAAVEPASAPPETLPTG